MATITWKDGTKTNISDETEKNLREKFGDKEFKPVDVCHIRVDSFDSEYPVKISPSNKRRANTFCELRVDNDACILTRGEAHRLVKAIQAALAFGEAYHE